MFSNELNYFMLKLKGIAFFIMMLGIRMFDKYWTKKIENKTLYKIKFIKLKEEEIDESTFYMIKKCLYCNFYIRVLFKLLIQTNCI